MEWETLENVASGTFSGVKLNSVQMTAPQFKLNLDALSFDEMHQGNIEQIEISELEVEHETDAGLKISSLSIGTLNAEVLGRLVKSFLNDRGVGWKALEQTPD